MGVCDLRQSLNQLNNKHTLQYLCTAPSVGLQIRVIFIINVSADCFSDSLIYCYVYKMSENRKEE